ncbi:hypothetical protein, partial [Rhodoblastus sp.]|uniref:hypothetical protein n=1 Tax=Rhodoblastus sp. TaxID=1962975 RepID=UPI003F966CFD
MPDEDNPTVVPDEQPNIDALRFHRKLDRILEPIRNEAAQALSILEAAETELAFVKSRVSDAKEEYQRLTNIISMIEREYASGGKQSVAPASLTQPDQEFAQNEGPSARYARTRPGSKRDRVNAAIEDLLANGPMHKRDIAKHLVAAGPRRRMARQRPRQLRPGAG